MSPLDPPKNLTRNVLLGMFVGVFLAYIFFYFQDSFHQSVFQGIEKYLFKEKITFIEIMGIIIFISGATLLLLTK